MTVYAEVGPDRNPGPIEVFDAYLERLEALTTRLRAETTLFSHQTPPTDDTRVSVADARPSRRSAADSLD